MYLFKFLSDVLSVREGSYSTWLFGAAMDGFPSINLEAGGKDSQALSVCK